MIDSIDEAIQTGCQIKVDRCRYNELGQRIRLKDEYILHPYYLVTDKSQYYLICLMEKNGRLITELLNLRVDRFLSVEILKNKQARSIREIPKYKDGFEWGTTFTMNAGRVSLDDVDAEGMLKSLREKLG